MKVLHVTSGNLYGGIETMLVAMARHRDAVPAMESQFAVCFEGRCRSELLASGAKVHDVGSVRVRNPLTIYRARRRMADVIDSEQPDVIVFHASWPLAVFGATGIRSGRPLVLWQHGPIGTALWLERWAQSVTPDLVICNSGFTAAMVESIYDPSKTCVLLCPVTCPTNAVWEDSSCRDSFRAELGASQSDVVIVQVSRLEEWKGHRLHLDALSLLRDLPNWVCWIVGGPQRPSERRLLRELQLHTRELGIVDRVRFVGQRSDVPNYLAAADIHCQPNVQPEPFGITFIEALYAGLPVVTTAMGGALEIVDDSCGLLAMKPTAPEIASLLRRLIEEPDLRRQLGSAGPRRATALCDPVQQLRTMSRLLGTLAPRERASA